MEWGAPVCLTSVEKIEEILDCNLYVFSLNDAPVLKPSINLWNSLVFKSVSRDKNKYCLLYDDIEKSTTIVLKTSQVF